MMRVNWTEQIDLSTQRSSEMEKCGCGKQSFDKMVILASITRCFDVWSKGNEGAGAEKLTRSFLNIVDKTTGTLLPNDQSINFFMSRL